MFLIINEGKEEILGSDLNLNKSLKIRNIELPEMVSVQLNSEFIDRELFEPTKEADEVDYLYFMGGGNLSYVD